MDGEVVPLPQRDHQQDHDRTGTPESALAVVQHPLDTSEPVPMRNRQEVLIEALLLVPNLAKLLYRLLFDNRVPRRRRLAMLVVGAYVASPIDLIPDFIPVIGNVDDLIVLAFAVDFLLCASPPEVVEEHWDGSADGLELVRGIAGWGVEVLPDGFRRLLEPW